MRVLCKKFHQSQIISAPTHFCCFGFFRSSFLQLATDLQLFYYNQRISLERCPSKLLITDGLVMNITKDDLLYLKTSLKILISFSLRHHQFQSIHCLNCTRTSFSFIHFFLKTRLYKVCIGVNRIGCVVFIPFNWNWRNLRHCEFQKCHQLSLLKNGNPLYSVNSISIGQFINSS